MHPDIISKFNLHEVESLYSEGHTSYRYAKNVFMEKMADGKREGMVKIRWVENYKYHETYLTEQFLFDMPIDFINKIVTDIKK